MTKITFLGDIMCTAELMDVYKVGSNKYDFTPMFKRIIPLLSESDYVLGNMETPISYDNSLLTNEKFCFNSPFEFAQSVFNAGINFVATANNHCLDRGIKGILSTVKSLNEIGFQHSGIFADKETCKPLVIKVNGLKIGIVSYTYGTNAFVNHQYLKRNEKWHVNLFQNQELSNPIDRIFYVHRHHPICWPYKMISELIYKGQMSRPVYEHREFDYACKRKVKRDILSLKEVGADILVMYMHAGGQFNTQPTSYTKKLTDWLLGLGVNIIAGSHEHVLHGGVFGRIAENKIATYSLGNFNGVYGVWGPPFDKMAEYTVAWHIYINDNKVIEKTTYSILKTIPVGNGRIVVVPCYDLLHDGSLNALEAKNLIHEMQIISKIFAGIKSDDNTLVSSKELFL